MSICSSVSTMAQRLKKMLPLLGGEMKLAFVDLAPRVGLKFESWFGELAYSCLGI